MKDDSTVKDNDIIKFARKWMELGKKITLNEISQKKTNMLYTHLWVDICFKAKDCHDNPQIKNAK